MLSEYQKLDHQADGQKMEGKVKFLTLFLIAIAMVFCFGCGEEQPEQLTETPPVDVPDEPDTPPVEIDLYAEAPLLQVGFVKQDHHSAVFVSALRSAKMK